MSDLIASVGPELLCQWLGSAIRAHQSIRRSGLSIEVATCDENGLEYPLYNDYNRLAITTADLLRAAEKRLRDLLFTAKKVEMYRRTAIIATNRVKNQNHWKELMQEIEAIDNLEETS